MSDFSSMNTTQLMVEANRLRKKLKKTLGRLKSRVQKGSKLSGVDLTGNQDLVDLLVSIEL